MVETAALWAFTLGSCVLLGEAVCRLAGWPRWSWLSGAAGISVLLILGAAGSSLPGHAATSFLLIAVLTAAAGLWIAWSDRAEVVALGRRAIDPALLAFLVFSATMIPFLANGRIGLLGPSFNNDSRFHVWAAEFLLHGQSVPEEVLGHGYPLGPHGLIAALSSGFGTAVENGFVALLMIIPVLTAFAVRALLTDLRRPWAILTALATAMTYLLTSYYAQAAFKETLQALFVLAMAVAVRDIVTTSRFGPRAAPVPALLAAASLLTYSYPGLAWLGGTLGIAAVVLLVVNRGALRRLDWRKASRRALPTLAVLGGVLAIALGPQAGRIVDFFRQLSFSPSGSGVITNLNVGNLIDPLSPFEGAGIWFREDFRFMPSDELLTVLGSALALGVALFGVVWWVRRREWVVLSATAASLLLYLVLRNGESAYLAAKALVVLSPLPVLLGLRALLADAPGLPVKLKVLRVTVTVLFVGGLAWSSFLALRNGQVNPSSHEGELVSLRPLVAGHEVLFLGHDDYIGWRLFGATVTDPPVQAPVPFELRKSYDAFRPLDFDSVTSATLDRFDYVVVPRTAYGSEPPTNFARVRQTASYDVYERHGRTPRDALLETGDAPGAVLDCAGNADDRRLSRRGGRALVRPAPVVVQGPPGMGAGFTLPAEVTLPSGGRWELSLQYVSPQVLEISTDMGQGWALPPNLDRLGPYWRFGDITTRGRTTVRLGLRLTRAAPSILTADSQYAATGRIAAVRVDRPAHWVPLRQACGRYVDRYRL
jgi:hypothetical protein